jgi:hypothetical protein
MVVNVTPANAYALNRAEAMTIAKNFMRSMALSWARRAFGSGLGRTSVAILILYGVSD